MRNRVVPVAARTAAMTGKLVLVMVLAPVALVALAQSASAATLADGDVAATSVSFGLLGPVGIAAVALGFGGLVVGLLRHRRREATTPATTRATARATAMTTVTLPVDSSGTLPVLEVASPVEQAAAERVG